MGEGVHVLMWDGEHFLTARKAAETMVLGETRGGPLRSSLTPLAFLTALSSCPLFRLVPYDPAIAALRKGT
jgi:hypothetical protein